jgi:hypothetical protein
VLDGVLGERLQQQHRHEDTARLLVDVEGAAQVSREAHALDVQVLLEQRELARERDFLLDLAAEDRAQQVAQSHEHRLGSVRVAVHEPGERVQRVEEEVRVELPLE